MQIRNVKISDEEFLLERQETLKMWPTGEEVDLEEAIAFHKSLPKSKNCCYKIAEAKQKQEKLLVCDMGYTTLKHK